MSERENQLIRAVATKSFERQRRISSQAREKYIEKELYNNLVVGNIVYLKKHIPYRIVEFIGESEAIISPYDINNPSRKSRRRRKVERKDLIGADWFLHQMETPDRLS